MKQGNRFIVLIGSLYYFYVSIQMNQFNSLSKVIMMRFSLSPTQYAKISAIYLLATLIFLFPMGILLDKYSTKKILLIAASVSTLVSFMFSIATNYPVIMIINFIGGIAASASFLGAVKLAWKLLRTLEIAFWTGLIITMGMMGAIMAQTPFLILEQHLGFKNVLLLLGAIGMIITTCIFLFIPAFIDAEKKPADNPLSLYKKIKTVFINHQNWVSSCFTAFQNLPIIVLGSVWGTFFVSQYYHYNTIISSSISMMLFIGMIIAPPVAGLLSDTLKNRKKIICAGSICSLILSLTLYLPSNIFFLIILFFLIGFFAGFQTIGYTMIAENSPDPIKASATSFTAIIVMLCGVIFQPLFAYILENTGHTSIQNNTSLYSHAQLQAALCIFPIASLICIFLSMMSQETFIRNR